ncbi:MAG: smalltalk protein, partial [Prevotella sp.]
ATAIATTLGVTSCMM